MRIVTLTLHPAIDRVLCVESLEPGATFDAQLAITVPAGKGVNTARSLSCLPGGGNRKIVAAVWLGAGEARWFSEQLADGAHIRAAVCARECLTRFAYTILEPGGRETHIKEFMPPVTAREEKKLLSFWKQTIQRGDLFAFCGSAPQQTSASTLASLFKIARRCAKTIIADTNGPALRIAGEMSLDGIKGNASEIGQWLGLAGPLRIEEKAHRETLRDALARPGAPRTILMTMGATGAVLATQDELYFAGAPGLPDRLGKSATGCGDAATAGWIWALQAGASPDEQLCRAVACGSAKFASADPGELAPKFVKELMRAVRIESVAGY